MSKYWRLLCAALVVCIVGTSCARREFAAARVKLPVSTQSQLVSHAESAAFAADVRARAAKNGMGDFEVRVHKYRDTSLLELGAFARDPQVAAKAANLMVTVLTEFAVAHKLGAVELIDAVVTPNR